MNLFGKRKYLNKHEREAFLEEAKKNEISSYLFCRILHETGIRISECLNIKPINIDFTENNLYIESLKKRKKGVFRRIPLSDVTILLFKKYIQDARIPKNQPLWDCSRMTAYRIVNRIMLKAGISADQASPKALRHAFAVSAIEAGIPISLIQKWLGHVDLKTTSIYTDLVGHEERSQASRLWSVERKDTIFPDSSSIELKHGISPVQPASEYINYANTTLITISGSGSDTRSGIIETQTIAPLTRYVHDNEEPQKPARTVKTAEKISPPVADRIAIEIYINKNLLDPDLNISLISQQFNLSKSAIHRMFKQDEGLASFITKKRLSIAFRWLSAPSQPHQMDLETIACNLGFSSQRSFSDAFFIHFGYHPSKMRRYAPALRNVKLEASAHL
ncbi:tyrosine-type recombinase/integrase [Brucella gallinifaecis]|uniref:Helix-turn-helix domain-containing protein n=1 Tax=Brucella gallinifaecis TaxID=215590 RepID=A0A502BNN0_9HYPH|nr:tyrosine-type recombinase/integrase [Brucella gallinifaecis]TPF75417.1 helix-turn-helix domain-containing protein [Brucella gallinifaecis]